MNIKCKTCGSDNVVLLWESIMSFTGSCKFQCQECNASFSVPVTDVQTKLAVSHPPSDCASSYANGGAS